MSRPVAPWPYGRVRTAGLLLLCLVAWAGWQARSLEVGVPWRLGLPVQAVVVLSVLLGVRQGLRRRAAERLASSGRTPPRDSLPRPVGRWVYLALLGVLAALGAAVGAPAGALVLAVQGSAGGVLLAGAVLLATRLPGGQRP